MKYDRIRIAANSYLFVEGSEPDYLYIVEEGEVVLESKSRFIHFKCEPGMLFGEVSILSNEKRFSSAYTTANTTLIRIHKNKIRAAFRENKSLRMSILKNISVFLQDVDNKFALLRSTAEQENELFFMEMIKYNVERDDLETAHMIYDKIRDKLPLFEDFEKAAMILKTVDLDSINLVTSSDSLYKLAYKTMLLENNPQKGLEYFELFCNLFPTDENCPNALLNAAKCALSINDFQRELSYLEKLIRDYPDHETLPEAVYLLHPLIPDEKEKLETLREMVKNKYPSSPFWEKLEKLSNT